MRHQKHRRTLGVKKEHRSALLANLASSLIQHGRIRTTTARSSIVSGIAPIPATNGT